jgi:hypothetical protein
MRIGDALVDRTFLSTSIGSVALDFQAMVPPGFNLAWNYQDKDVTDSRFAGRDHRFPLHRIPLRGRFGVGAADSPGMAFGIPKQKTPRQAGASELLCCWLSLTARFRLRSARW